jgi:hypothetical protein
VNSRFLQIRRSRWLTGKWTWHGAHAPTASPRAIPTAAKPRELRRCRRRRRGEHEQPMSASKKMTARGAEEPPPDSRRRSSYDARKLEPTPIPAPPPPPLLVHPIPSRWLPLRTILPPPGRPQHGALKPTDRAPCGAEEIRPSSYFAPANPPSPTPPHASRRRAVVLVGGARSALHAHRRGGTVVDVGVAPVASPPACLRPLAGQDTPPSSSTSPRPGSRRHAPE